ncbi:MAG: Glu-tRNA(Gln) amidotransferase subunit GatE [Candidatus Parcubacteria bacterium]|nr:Glu-tRNA(Gln) amidotransferase subunit GatE [Candidatus Parcubacteria bacterium]
MEENIDYTKIGLKSGLEIHQQLDTGKLFCKCPSFLRNDNPDYIVERKLHAVAGETGKIDEAALYQASLEKKFIYQCYKDNVCLVDLDEEPPHEINKESLKIALQIALLLNCKILPVSQIMRKTVIDGSNTSGFQRTTLIAKDGFVETTFGKVAIDYLFLEEDAARTPTKKEGEIDEPGFENSKIFRLDRLGIPLVEIATGPHMHSPEQIKEAALKIGEILRSCKVKRGIGTIRQDLNISIKGSERVEIKGFQDPRIMIETVKKEIERQQKCVKEKACKREVRKSNPDSTTSFLRPMPGANRMYPETDLPLLKISRELINDAKKTLPKLKGEKEEELKLKGLNNEMIKILLNENKVDEFKELLEIYDNPNLIVKMILIFPKEIASHEKISNLDVVLDQDVLASILELLKDKKIQESHIKELMSRIAKGQSFDTAIMFESTNINEIEEKIMKIIKEKPGLNANAYMGLVMKELKGKLNGKEAMEIIQKHVKN